MPKQALYLKWRPQTFDDVIGQEHITRTLLNSINTGRIRHAYLFSGPRGTGKTTTARLLAHALGSQNMDLIEIDAASHTGVDDVRDLRDKIAFLPAEGQYKVYIIDEVHRFSGSAFDALLKTLEEPPEHAIFVLATTEIDKVPDTIKSRCLQFEFRRVPLTDVADHLQMIATEEGLKIDRNALELMARHGTGSVRDSISLLDQIVADPQEHITLELTQKILGTASSESVLELAEAILTGDVVNGLHIINQAVNTGSDPRQFGQQVVEHLRHVLLAQTSSADLIEASDEMRELYSQQAELTHKQAVLRAIRAFNDAINDQRSGWQPQLALELALVDAVTAQQERSGTSNDTTSFIPPQEIAAMVDQMVAQRLATMGGQIKGGGKSNPTSPSTPVVEEIEADPSAPTVVALSQIQGKWAEVKRASHKSGNIMLPALLDHITPYSVSGNVLTLAVKMPVFQERMNSGKNRSTLEFILHKLHGERLKINVIVSDQDSSEGSKAPEPGNAFTSIANELGAEIEETEPRTDKTD